MAKSSIKSDVDFIKALAYLLIENDLTELDVEREYSEGDRLSVRVSRAKQVVQTSVQVAAPAQVQPLAPFAATPTTSPETTSGDPASHPGAVPSPMVGTVYLQTEPGASPFVKIGDTIAEGDTLLIVEAMKTMNHIPAPHSGVLKRILVADGDPVEFGAPLMIVE
ncbi:MAG: acetyl-CoA carboxylase biotin carboxyl carrier protein [Paracoccaceae bacterium]